MNISRLPGPPLCGATISDFEPLDFVCFLWCILPGIGQGHLPLALLKGFMLRREMDFHPFIFIILSFATSENNGITNAFYFCFEFLHGYTSAWICGGDPRATELIHPYDYM